MDSKKTKSIWIYIIILFVVTRIMLSALTYVSFTYLEVPKNMSEWRKEKYENHPFLTQWTLRDSSWYLRIAEDGYTVPQPFNTKQQQEIGFFPLFPILIGGLGFILGDLVIAGLLISNTAFILACYFLYKLISLETSESDGKRAILYLFFFPTAYIFSALYAESLLLLLIVLALYTARKKQWLLAGAFGFFATLTKSIGFLVALPIVLMYLNDIQYSWKKIRPDIVYSALIPLGLLIFGWYCFILTGDFFAYSHVQQGAWNHSFTNPFVTLYKSLFTINLNTVISAIGNCLVLGIFAMSYKKIPLAYWLYGIALVLFPLATGEIIGTMRYFVTAVPLIFLLALYGKNESVDRILLPSMALLQGFFVVFWSANFWFIT